MRRPWLRYLHWLGYATTAIVLTQMTVVAYVLIAEWRQNREHRRGTLMHARPAETWLVRDGRDSANILLAALPTASALGADGLRIVAMPTFGDTHFAVALRPTAAGGVGVLLAMPATGPAGSVVRIPLRLSPTAYDTLMERIDARISTWEGGSGWGTDGTAVIVERVTAGRVASAFGNHPDFHERIGAFVFDAVRPLTPALARYDKDWHPRDL